MTKKSFLHGLFPVEINVGEQAFSSNVRSAIERDIPWLQQSEARPDKVVIVGGGPSLADVEDELLAKYKNGDKFIALNNTAKWLIDRGMTPHYHVLLDGRASLARFIVKVPETHYLIASQCDPSVFDAVGDNVTLWHPHVEDIKDYIGDRETALIGGGTTVGLQGISIAYAIGFRHITLAGYDSSYRGDEGHAYKQPENDGEQVIEVFFANRKFRASPWMCIQVEEFKGVMKQVHDLGCELHVMGDGFLQETYHEMHRTALVCVYDLCVSPPTYEFVTFLGEAEKARIAAGHRYIDVIFMPGPVDGFRDDNLPPSSAEREGMLHRICVSLCRLLPSVRNVTISKERVDVNGDIFPKDWNVLTPKNHYGPQYMTTAIPVFTASEKAKKHIARLVGRNYVTITLREADYWPDRNSNVREWELASRSIKALGYEVLWIPDIESKDSNAMSWDVDLRLAAYEGAIVNLGVTNGPMCLLPYSNTRFVVFKMVAKNSPCADTEFLEKMGLKDGFILDGRGKYLWCEDTADKIFLEFLAMLPKSNKLTA